MELGGDMDLIGSIHGQSHFHGYGVGIFRDALAVSRCVWVPRFQHCCYGFNELEMNRTEIIWYLHPATAPKCPHRTKCERLEENAILFWARTRTICGRRAADF